ncbi:TPA: hypothetical protein ACKFH8_004182, partial [Burkholderia multivorans]
MPVDVFGLACEASASRRNADMTRADPVDPRAKRASGEQERAAVRVLQPLEYGLHHFGAVAPAIFFR